MTMATHALEYVVYVGGVAIHRTTNKYEAQRVALEWEESLGWHDVWIEEPQF